MCGASLIASTTASGKARRSSSTTSAPCSGRSARISLFLEPVSFVNGKSIFIGDHVFINSNVTFIDAAPIEIGDHTMIAPGCVITTVDHPKQPGERREFTSRAQAIKIGSDVWIGANCTIFPGVTIGDNVIIGSNSVVNKDIPSNTIAFGSPARPHRAIEDDTGDAPSA